MDAALPPLTTLNGKHTAYCGLCWEPVYRLWVDAEAPDYTACPFGPYTAQTCPEATGAAQRAAVSAELKRRGLTLAEYMRTLSGDPSPPSEEPGATGTDRGRDEP